MADSKKLSKNFSRKFHRLVLGLVGLIDAKGHQCSSSYMVVRLSDIGAKNPKNTKNAFFTCFCPYIRQPHNHNIG